MADNKIQNSIDAVRKGLKEILTDMEVIDKKIIATAANAQKIGSGFKANTPDGLTQILKQQNDLLAKMNGLLDTQNNNTKKLNTSRRTLKQLSSDEVVNQRKLAKNADLQAQSTSKLVGAYDRLNAKYRQSKQRLNDLNASHRATKKEVRAAEREFKKYQNRINQVNKATSNFSNNSLGGMVRGFRNLLGAFGLVGGVTLIAGLAKDFFNLIKTLESLEYALETVTESASELVSVQEFLNDISIRYGANLVVTTERFTKFLAAAKQSNLGLNDTKRIFESVTKASSVLGLKTDELTGVYLALEQMLSKGKVTTEELRRQLGERLPGAFGIMAEALGVSVSKLDEMLKKGEILSSEALPKFAEQLEKSYGIEAVKTVDTLAAAQGRLETAWISFVDSVNTSEGTLSKIFKSLLEDVQLMLQDLEDFIKTSAELNKDEVESAQTKAFNEALARADAIGKQHGEEQRKIAAKLLERMADETDKNRQNLIEQIDLLFGSEEDETRRVLSDADKQRMQEMQVEIAKLTGTSDAYRQKIEQLLKVKKEETDEDNKKLEALKGTIAFWQQRIKQLEDEQSKLAQTEHAYNGYSMAIEQAKENLQDLINTFDLFQRQGGQVDIVDGISKGLDFEDIQKKFDEAFGLDLKDQLKKMVGDSKDVMDDFYDNWENTMDSAEAYAELKLNTVKEIFGGVFDTFSEAFDFDFSSTDFIFESLLDKENELFSTDNIDEWANFSKEAIRSVLDASLQRYQIELQEAQRSRDLIVNNELATEKEKRLAREKFEEEERRIKTKQAKEERRNTLIKIAADTAAGIVSALAQIPKFDFGISATAFAAFIAASGATQAALVASQPLPRFKEGTKAPLANDTLAWVGDGGRKEAITKGGKLLDITPDRPTLAMLPKGAEVQKDASEWINNAIYRMNMSANGELLSSFDADYMLHDELKKMRSANDRTWQEVKKLAKRPIFVNNTVKVIQEDSYKI